MKRIVNKIKRCIKGIYNKIWFLLHSNGRIPLFDDTDSVWCDVKAYLSNEENDTYVLDKLDITFEDGFKWVGGVYHDNKIIGIANGSMNCLVVNSDTDKVERIGHLPDDVFKWSGGCVWNGKIYGFPRTSNHLMVFDLCNGVLPKQQNLSTTYKSEHHYGGVCTDEGIVYQPPRSTNCIQKINLNTGEVKSIVIGNRTFRYCGSILHPNGLIYMFPERDHKVLVIDPQTDKIFFIGKCITSMVFGACVGMDGNIYGFSAYESGILKIDVSNNTTEMLLKKYKFGCYGSVLGLNGRIYGIPGDGNKIYEFDVEYGVVKILKELDEQGHAKCAGAAMSADGSIYCIPAMGNKMYVLRPSKKHFVPKSIIESRYLNGNY